MLRIFKEKEKVLILAEKKNQPLFFDGNKRVSAFNPGFIDLFLHSDLTRLEELIKDSSFNIFITHTYPFLDRATALIAASYENKEGNNNMFLVTKRKTRIPEKTFFDNSEQLIFHRKYKDDSTGIKMRAEDAKGIESIRLGTAFSVEIFFYLTPQFYPKATLISNLLDSNGFVIGNVSNTSKYFFGINGTAYIAPMTNYKWYYYAMNVFPNHIEIYVNGSQILSYPLHEPMRNSGNKLYIGNHDNFQYYIGAISEVAITKTTLDSNQIQATWKEIKQVVGK